MTNTGPGALGAHALELDGATIGIVLPEGSRHVRFYTADAAFRRLDGQLFRGAREVLAAAREAFNTRPPHRPPPDLAPRPSSNRRVDPGAERIADPVSAAPDSRPRAF